MNNLSLHLNYKLTTKEKIKTAISTVYSPLELEIIYYKMKRIREYQIKQLPHNIIGLTKTENRQELIDLYSAADLFINTTWEDNFPTTNIESLACGTPLVTYRTGGSIEAVSSETGYIVEKGDIYGLAKVIKTVKNNGKQAYSEACRKRAIDFYSKDDRFAEYFNLYEKLMQRKEANKFYD